MENRQKYYKAFNEKLSNGQLICIGFDYSKKYRIGHNHYAKGKPKLCYNGMHYCHNLAFVYETKPIGSVITEVIPKGKKHHGPQKNCCTCLYVVREIGTTEILNILLKDILNENNPDHVREISIIVLTEMTSVRNSFFSQVPDQITVLSNLFNKVHNYFQGKITVQSIGNEDFEIKIYFFLEHLALHVGKIATGFVIDLMNICSGSLLDGLKHRMLEIELPTISVGRLASLTKESNTRFVNNLLIKMTEERITRDMRSIERTISINQNTKRVHALKNVFTENYRIRP